MTLTVIDPRSLDQTGDYTVNNITVTGAATLTGPANLVIGGGTTDQVLSTNGSGILNWVTASGGGGGVTSYALEANLPVSATNGDLGYVTGTNKMYLYNGSIWVLVFTATTPNLAPAITAGPESGYLLSTTGTPVVITMAAQDPESVPINWSYTITGGTLGSVATIAQTDNVFTITPSTNTANGGAFELTITASDGVNVANARTYFRLYFTVSEPSYGLNFVSSLPPPTNIFVNSTNAAFGLAVAASGGTLAVLGKGVTGAGSVDTATYSVYIYTTLAGADPVYQTKIDLPIESSYTLTRKLCLTSNMLIVSGKDVAGGNTGINRWYVYFKTNDTTWTLTQTIQDGNPNLLAANIAPMDISDTGLVFVCATSEVVTSIYTRQTTATTTWTLRQSIPIADVPSTVADNDVFPTHIKVSASGRHIALSSSAPDQVSPVVANSGKVVIFTNATYSSGGYVWGAAYTNTQGQFLDASGYITVTSSPKYDDIFYVFRESLISVPSLYCIKYTSASNSWSEYTYDTTQVTRFLTIFDAYNSGWINTLDPYLMTAIAGPSNSMSFLCVKRCKLTNSAAGLVTFKFPAADLSINPTNNKISTGYTIGATANSLISNANHWNSASDIPNPGNVVLNVKPCIDNLTGEVFLGAQNTSWGGITGSGVVHRYQLHNSIPNATTKEFLIPSGTTSVFTLTVPAKCTYMSAVLIGGGGGGCGTTTATDTSGGASGGSLVAFSNYPVIPGYSLTAKAGAGGAPTSTRTTGGNGGDTFINYNSSAAIWTANGGAGGPIAGGAAGRGSSTPTVTGAPYYNIVIGQGGTGGAGGTATQYASGGGGAGGYGGQGGNGQSGSAGQTSSNASLGGGGGGGCTAVGGAGLNGGGTGLYGIGSNGIAGLTTNGGSGSTDSGLPITAYGGGGGSSGYTTVGAGSTGGLGGLRIIFSDAPIYTFTNSISSTIPLVRNPEYTGS